MKTEPLNLTGLTLLNKTLELVTLGLHSREWRFMNFESWESGSVRLKQLTVLSDLFLNTHTYQTISEKALHNILNGDFIDTRNPDDYQQLVADMDDFLTGCGYKKLKRDDWDLSDIQDNYCRLIRYKVLVNELLRVSEGVMEVSYPLLYAHRLITQTSERIELSAIDNFLHRVIDPAQRTFSRDYLIETVEYPSEDVYDIDLDSW